MSPLASIISPCPTTRWPSPCAPDKLRRNFQGYTVDQADALLPFGASSIGRLPQGYVQNAADVGTWRRAIEAGRFATVKGAAFTRDDLARAAVIERLMCDFSVDFGAIAENMLGDVRGFRRGAGRIWRN